MRRRAGRVGLNFLSFHAGEPALRLGMEGGPGVRSLHQADFSRMVTNSSAAVGWMPTVASN